MVTLVYISKLVSDPDLPGAVMPAVLEYSNGLAVHGAVDTRGGFWIGQVTADTSIHDAMSVDNNIRVIHPSLWNVKLADLPADKISYMESIRQWLNIDPAFMNMLSPQATVGFVVTALIGMASWPVLKDFA